MKKFLWLVLVVLVFLLTGCSAAQGVTNGLMQLPEEGRLLVLIAVTAGVTWGLLKLSQLTGVDLKGHAGPVAAGVAPIFVTLIEAGLRLIPPIFDNIVLAIIHLIVLLVGSVGTFFLFKRKVPSLQ